MARPLRKRGPDNFSEENRMTTPRFFRPLALALMLALASTAHAQTSDPKWSADVAIGWDNTISGNINSSAIGAINNQTVVILTNQYEDVYGSGLHIRVGGGYRVNANTEARVNLSFQSADSDLATLGDYGASPLYADYSDYKSTSLDVGLRRYGRVNTNLRPYIEGTIGLGWIDDIDADLVAPQANLRVDANNFYQSTTAFGWAVQAGLLMGINERLGGFAQLGLRYTSGLAEVDNFVGSGLEGINDHSSRWTIPFLVGVRVGF
jgi:opacity protein-like surface antigen